MAVPIVAGVIVGALVTFAVKILTVIGAYIIYRVFLWKGGVAIDWILSKVGSVDLSNSTLELVGLAGWLADCLQVQECLTLAVSFAVSAFIVRFALSFK